jgi:hypothetical protein
MLTRIAQLIATPRAARVSPIVTQLERDLRSTREDVEGLRGALYVAKSDRDSYRDHAQRWLDEAAVVKAERDALQARLDALTPAPVRPLSAERRRAILEAVAGLIGMVSPSVGYAPTAESIAEYIDTDAPECLCTVSPSSTMRFVSRLAAEGWLVSDGHRPARYRLSESGRADLAVAA